MDNTYRLHPQAAAKGCATFCGILYLLCVLAFAVAPVGTIAFLNFFFHGIDLAVIAKQSVSWGSAFAGFIVTVVATYVLTLVWVALYHAFLGARGSTSGAQKS